MIVKAKCMARMAQLLLVREADFVTKLNVHPTKQPAVCTVHDHFAPVVEFLHELAS